MALAFVFPGQGSQFVGMGRDLAAAFPCAREVFGAVDESLKQHLSRLMFAGEPADLTLTANAQPALMAVSLAVLRVLEVEGGLDLRARVSLVAGHSLGEYSALAAARAFDVATAARLLRLRGDAMQAAVRPGVGAMAALLGAEAEQARGICARAAVVPERASRPAPAEASDEAGGDGAAPASDDEAGDDAGPEDGPEPGTLEVVEVANDNGGGQVVVSGHAGAVDRACAIARAEGVRRAMRLPVSAPFHCALMLPAAAAMAEALAEAGIAAPVVPLVANVSAAKATDPAAIRELLVRQVTGTVRWRECVAAMAAMGCHRFVELGAGRVLTGLMKRNAPDATALACGTPAEVEALLKAL